MAPHSSTLAWKIPWTGEPGRLQTMVSLRVRHDWATSLSLFTFMHWRRKWQPTPVFLPGESQGRGSLVGCRLWGRTELDTTETTWQTAYIFLICIYESLWVQKTKLFRWGTYYPINNWHTIAFPTFLNIDPPLCLSVYKSFWLASRGIQRHITPSHMYSLS